MSKFLDSRFNKISYLTPSLSSSYITPKTHFSGVESEGRFRRVASYVLVSQNACPLHGISDGPDGPKFDVRARVSPSRSLRLAGGQGAAPSGARFAPLRVVIPPAAGLGRAVSASGCASPVLAILAMLALRVCVAPGCSGRPLTLPHPSKRAYGPLRASWIRSSGLPGPQGTE